MGHVERRSRGPRVRSARDAARPGHDRKRAHGSGASECTIEVPFRVEFERPGGTVRGPVFIAAADVAIWFAVATRLGTDGTWVTVDLKTAFLRAARREPITCTARVVKIGGQLVYPVAECVCGDETLLTHHTGLYAPIQVGRRAAARRR